MEELTDTIEKEANDIIKSLENMGGVIEGIESGWIQNQIAQSASRYQESIDSKERIIIGVNEFKTDIIKDNKTMEIDESSVNIQLKKVSDFENVFGSGLVADRDTILVPKLTPLCFLPEGASPNRKARLVMRASFVDYHRPPLRGIRERGIYTPIYP